MFKPFSRLTANVFHAIEEHFKHMAEVIEERFHLTEKAVEVVEGDLKSYASSTDARLEKIEALIFDKQSTPAPVPVQNIESHPMVAKEATENATAKMGL